MYTMIFNITRKSCGGVMIMVRMDQPELKCADLPDINQGCNNTMEYNWVQIFLVVDNKPLPFDIFNVYIPPIGGGNDHCIKRFNAERTFSQITQEAINYESVGVLIAGDVNAHAYGWNCYASEDAIGEEIEDFLDKNGFMIMNDTLPTYHSHHENAAKTHVGETAPDVTFLKSDTVNIRDWKRQHPIGFCHNDVIKYSVDFGEVDNPLRPHNRATPKRMS
eukprot:8966607-Ditylum_brightwellii.AAC.1